MAITVDGKIPMVSDFFRATGERIGFIPLIIDMPDPEGLLRRWFLHWQLRFVNCGSAEYVRRSWKQVLLRKRHLHSLRASQSRDWRGDWSSKPAGWWFGTFFIFTYIYNHIYIYIRNTHPNWLIFFRGIETTNQQWFAPFEKEPDP